MNPELESILVKELKETNRDELLSQIKEKFPKTRGRKKLSPDDDAVNTVFRLPKKEKEKLILESKKKGVSLSQLIRESLTRGC